MEIKESDCKKMMFPYHLIGDKDPLEVFPRLAKYEEFNAKIAYRDKIIKYIILVYDPGSPLHRYDNLAQKKAVAATCAGFVHKKDVFEESVVKMMDCRIYPINLMIIRMCRIFGDKVYSLLVAGNEAFYNALSQLVNYTSTEDPLKDMIDKQKIFQGAKSVARDIDAMSAEFLSGDDSKPIQKTLYSVVDSESSGIKLTPEDYAV